MVGAVRCVVAFVVGTNWIEVWLGEGILRYDGGCYDEEEEKGGKGKRTTRRNKCCHVVSVSFFVLCTCDQRMANGIAGSGL